MSEERLKALVLRLLPAQGRAYASLRWLKRSLWQPLKWLAGGAALAYVWRSLMFRTTVIAVTGSVGKSTCKELLAEVLASHAATHKTLNNENDLYGVPGVLLGIRPWHAFAVIELGASGPGTMRRLARLVRPDIAIVTAVAHTHTNRYSGIDEIAEEKFQLVRFLKRGGLAILNGDDERVAAMGKRAKGPVKFFGRASDHDLRATQVHAQWPERLSLTVVDGVGDRMTSLRLQTQLVGEHWVNSVLAAMSAAHACGIELREAGAVISKRPPFRARMQPVRLANGAVMIRDENASLDVLDAMLKVARSARAERKVIVLGDVTDAGQSKSSKRLALAGERVASAADVALFVGRSSRHAAKAAIAAGLPERCVIQVEGIAQADEALKGLVRPGDLIFVKGLSTQHLSRLVFAQLGQIGCWVDRCTIRKDCDICPRLQPNFDLVRSLHWDATGTPLCVESQATSSA